MDPALGGIIGAGISTAGGALGSMINANQAGIDRDDRRYYAEHAHQIEMADLKAAGLNPILTATGGRGASFQGASGNSSGDPLAAGVESAAKQVGTLPERQRTAAVAELQAAGMVLDNAGKAVNNSQLMANLRSSLFDLDKKGAQSVYYKEMAALEKAAQEGLIGLQDAQATANQASAAVSRASIGKMDDERANIREDTAGKKQARDFSGLRGGYSGVAGDIHNLGTRAGNSYDAAADYVKHWTSKMLGGEPNMSVGVHSAKGRGVR
ncbi:MAG: DNA pilot protein [Microvirus sp.]|nr:MAG: DNA pilot protein [Microvirus sp.]